MRRFICKHPPSALIYQESFNLQVVAGFPEEIPEEEDVPHVPSATIPLPKQNASPLKQVGFNPLGQVKVTPVQPQFAMSAVH